MRKIITKAQAIRYTAYIILAILILAIFPCRLFKEDIVTKGVEQPAGAVSVCGDNVALQQFAAEYDRISSIAFKLGGSYENESATLRVFKESTGELLREIPVIFSVADDYVDVYLNLETVVGDNYFYTIEGTGGPIDVLFEMTANSGAVNNGYMQYAGENKDAYNLVTRYTYRQPLRKMMSLVIIAVLLAAGVIITFAVNALEKKVPALKALTTPAQVIRIIADPIIVIGAVAAIVMIGPLHMFSIYIADIVIMILGVVLLAGFALYIINVRFMIPPEAKGYKEDASYFFTMKPAGWLQHTDYAPALGRFEHIAQSVCIALALLACVHYMNAFYEIFHDAAWRRMAFFLGLALIVTFSISELFNIYNLILLVGGVITARIYYVRNLPDMVDEYHTNAMFWTCMCIPVIFIISAYIIRCVALKLITLYKNRAANEPGAGGSGTEKHKASDMIPEFGERLAKTGLPKLLWALYAIFSVALVVAMVVRRNLRYWPVLMAVIVGVYAFRLLFWGEREHFTDNLTRGILFHFAGCVVYCLMHRPYEAFEYVRFPLVFHTVTITAEYMALVMAAAYVRLFGAYRKKRNVRGCLWEMFIFGCASTYMFFTMSRTAMIGIVATGLVMWIAYGIGFKKNDVTAEDAQAATDAKPGRKTKSCSPLITTACMVIVSMLFCFPIVFTAQKAIPGLVGEPKLMEIEKYPQTLLISKDYDSEEYITFTRFSKAFIHKMLGMDEDKIKLDLYTIYGKRTDVYLTHVVAEVDEDGAGYDESKEQYYTQAQAAAVNGQASDPEEPDTQYAQGILLSRNPVSPVMSDPGFVPPHDYSEEGDPPPEWYDGDYWVYDRDEGEWLFATWKLEEESDADVSNGRLDIFRSYLEQLNDEGHEDMGAVLPDGSIAAHAHNIYLQVAWDHGKIIGIMFAIWCLLTCIRAFIVFMSHKDTYPGFGILLAVSVTFTVCGITEWISHPCNPVGMVMLLTSSLLILPDIILFGEKPSKYK